MAREGSRSSSLDEEEAAAISPPARSEPDVDSNLMRRAGRILAFGVVATVIILLGLVSQFGGAAVSRVELGTPHDGMAVGNVVHLPDGNLAHRATRTSSAADVGALSPGERAAAARRAAARARRPSSREARRRHRQWDRDTEDAEAKTLAPDDQPLASLGQAQASETGGVAGVSLNGWLQLEEWFYSQDAHSLVDATEGTTQGVVFPPVFPTPESLGFEWASEGDLVAKLAASVGEDAAVAAVVAHRESYFTAEDVAGLREQGFDHVRLPLTWAAFASEADEPEKLVADPAHPDKKQVTVSRAALDRYVATLADAGLTVLIDMHTMPGGSSKGSYNGVFPSPPTFWDDPTLMTIGRGVVREMLRWYLALPETSRAAVGGFTLLNEPAHLLPDKRDVMLDWLAGAAADFRALVVDPARRVGARPPRLVVNLIETCGLNVYNMAEWMARTFAADELQSGGPRHAHVSRVGALRARHVVETTPRRSKTASRASCRRGERDERRRGEEWHRAHRGFRVVARDEPRLRGWMPGPSRPRGAPRGAALRVRPGRRRVVLLGLEAPSAGAHQKFWSAQFHGAEMAASDAAEADATAASGCPGEAVVETDAAASSDDVPAVAETIAAVEDADDAGVALASEAAEPEPEAKEAEVAEVAEDASEDVRAEPVEPAEPAKETRESDDAAPAEPADGREDEAAGVHPAGPAEPAEAVAGGEAASVDPGAQVQGEANVAMIDAARERAEAEARQGGEVDDEISARRKEVEARMRAGTNVQRGAVPDAVVAPDDWEAAVPETVVPEAVVPEAVVRETVASSAVVPEVDEQPMYDRPVAADENPSVQSEAAAAAEPVVEPVSTRNQLTRVM